MAFAPLLYASSSQRDVIPKDKSLKFLNVHRAKRMK